MLVEIDDGLIINDMYITAIMRLETQSPNSGHPLDQLTKHVTMIKMANGDFFKTYKTVEEIKEAIDEEYN